MRMTLADTIKTFNFTPISVFLDVKFTTRRMPYAYGLVVTQGDELRWETCAKAADFWRDFRKAEPDAMRAIDTFKNVDNVFELMRDLRDQLLQVERLDFMCGMNAGNGARELQVKGNSLTLVYAQLLMVNDSGFDMKEPVLPKGVTLKQAGAELNLPDPLFNPTSSAKAMAHLVAQVDVSQAA